MNIFILKKINSDDTEQTHKVMTRYGNEVVGVFSEEDGLELVERLNQAIEEFETA
jgi:hypothetical protein